MHKFARFMGKKVVNGLVISALMGLVGCGPRMYGPLSLVKQDNFSNTYDQDDLKIAVRQLSSSEVKTLFDGRGKLLFSQLEPVCVHHVRLKNNGSIPKSVWPYEALEVAGSLLSQQDLFEVMRHAVEGKKISLSGGKSITKDENYSRNKRLAGDLGARIMDDLVVVQPGQRVDRLCITTGGGTPLFASVDNAYDRGSHLFVLGG